MDLTGDNDGTTIFKFSDIFFLLSQILETEENPKGLLKTSPLRN